MTDSGKQSHVQHNVHWDYYIVATAFVVIIIHMKSINTNFLAFMFMPNKSIIIILQLLHYLVVQHVKNITVWCTWKILHRTDCYKSDFIRKICLCWGKKRTKFKIRRSLILRVSPELPWRVAGHYWTPIKLCVQRNAECWNSSLWTIRCFHSSSETLVNLTDTHFSSSWEQ